MLCSANFQIVLDTNEWCQFPERLKHTSTETFCRLLSAAFIEDVLS